MRKPTIGYGVVFVLFLGALTLAGGLGRGVEGTALGGVAIILAGFLFLKEKKRFRDSISEGYRKSEAPVLDVKNVQAAVAYISLEQVGPFLDLSAPAMVAVGLNEYVAVLASVVKKYDGMIQIYSERSLIGIWGADHSDGTDVWRALRASLEIREALANLIERRKKQSLQWMSVAVGIQWGPVAVIPLKNFPEAYFFLGEAVDSAKALSLLAFSAGVDLAVSQEVWQKSEARFEGELLSEAKLKTEDDWVNVFGLCGYRDEQGQVQGVNPHPDAVARSSEGKSKVIQVPQWASDRKKGQRWLVNNGSQIIGPLTSEEVAIRLFSQELDFDCECWTEEGGTPGKIRNSGMFSGSDSANASLWIFDGTTIHGPMLPGFLKTALGHGAIQSQVYFCEMSTVNGWKPIEQWDFNSAAPQVVPTLKQSIGPPSLQRKTGVGLDSSPKKKVA